MIIEDLNFICTCDACPEQYDVKDLDGNQVAYVRLRWGYLYCACPDCGCEKVYETDIGDGLTGCFEDEEQRKYHLNEIANAIHSHLQRNE